MPTSKQRREAAQRHLQRQLERRAEQAQKRRRNLGIVLAALALVVVVGAALLITGAPGAARGRPAPPPRLAAEQWAKRPHDAPAGIRTSEE